MRYVRSYIHRGDFSFITFLIPHFHVGHTNGLACVWMNASSCYQHAEHLLLYTILCWPKDQQPESLCVFVTLLPFIQPRLETLNVGLSQENNVDVVAPHSFKHCLLYNSYLWRKFNYSLHAKHMNTLRGKREREGKGKSHKAYHYLELLLASRSY